MWLAAGPRFAKFIRFAKSGIAGDEGPALGGRRHVEKRHVLREGLLVLHPVRVEPDVRVEVAGLGLEAAIDAGEARVVAAVVVVVAGVVVPEGPVARGSGRRVLHAGLPGDLDDLRLRLGLRLEVELAR